MNASFNFGSNIETSNTATNNNNGEDNSNSNSVSNNNDNNSGGGSGGWLMDVLESINTPGVNRSVVYVLFVSLGLLLLVLVSVCVELKLVCCVVVVG